MKTLKKTLMIGCIALAIVCMTAPLGHTQGVTTPKAICAKCGVVTPIGQCPPGANWTDRPCVDIKNFGRQKPAMTLPMGPATEPDTSLAGWLKARETRKAQNTSPGL